MRLDRHRLVYLDPERWIDVLEGYPDARAIPEVAGWVAAGFPLIGRRPVCDDIAQRVPLGLPLPPSLGKRRIAVGVPPETVVRTTAPPLISDAIANAPASWQPTIKTLVALEAGTRCFGSLAWAWLTGLDYLTTTSDLDLLWHVSDGSEAAALVSRISKIDAEAPISLDGEMVTPSGLAFQWREWASDAPELIVKTAAGTRLVARDALFT